MNAIEQRDDKITHMLEAQMPEYLELENRIDLERSLVLIPFADEAHIARWEKSLGIRPGAESLEGRRRYLITLITTKLKPSTETIEEMSYSFTGRHADVYMAIPKPVEMGVYISDESIASIDDNDYHWIDGDRIKNIRSMLLGYESDGVVKDVHDYFSETKDDTTIYKIHDEELFDTNNLVWLLGNKVIDTVEQISTEDGDMFIVNVDGKEYIVPRMRQRYINIAFASENVSNIPVSDTWGTGIVSDGVYYDVEPTETIATIDISDYFDRNSMFTDVAFDVRINEVEMMTDNHRGLRGIRQLQGDDGTQGFEYNNRYVHVAYANSSDGTVDFSVSDSTLDYIGLSYDFNLQDSSTPSDYRWHKISDLVPGMGIRINDNTYLHITWANSPNGIIDNDKTNSAGKMYVGVRVDGLPEYFGGFYNYKYTILTDDAPYKPNLLADELAFTPYKTEVQRYGYWRVYYSLPRTVDTFTIHMTDAINDIALANVALHTVEDMSYTYNGHEYVGLYLSDNEYTNLDYTKYHWQPIPSDGTLTDGDRFVHIGWKHEHETMQQAIIKPVENIKRNIIYIQFQGELPQLSFRRYSAYLRSVIPAHLDFIITFGEPMDIALYPYVYHGTHVSVTAFN